MKLSRLFMMGLMAAAMAFVSCSGEDGEDGDPGQSIKGDPGDKGDQGDRGEDGNANAMQYDITLNDPGGKSVFSVDLPQITQEVINDDTILFYFITSIDESLFHTMVPGLSAEGTFFIGADIEVGKVTFILRGFDGNPFPHPINELVGIKIIIIESSSTETIEGKGAQKTDILTYLQSIGVDINDYNAVSAHFGLE